MKNEAEKQIKLELKDNTHRKRQCFRHGSRIRHWKKNPNKKIYKDQGLDGDFNYFF